MDKDSKITLTQKTDDKLSLNFILIEIVKKNRL